MFNLDMDRLLHRHGDDWVEMKPITSSHSPDQADPERRLIHGEQTFRCAGCDEEMRVVSQRPPG